jgi:hypothetical protein
MANDNKQSSAVRDIITGALTIVIGIAIGTGWQTDTDWPKIILFGALIVGGFRVFAGINALDK